MIHLQVAEGLYSVAQTDCQQHLLSVFDKAKLTEIMSYIKESESYPARLHLMR